MTSLGEGVPSKRYSYLLFGCDELGRAEAGLLEGPDDALTAGLRNSRVRFHCFAAIMLAAAL